MRNVGIYAGLRFIVIVLVIIGAQVSPSAAQEFKWTYFSNVPVAHDYSPFIIRAFERVKTRTGGRLEIRHVYYGEVPQKATDALTVLRDGLTQMTEWIPSYSSGTYPILGAPELPFLPPKLLSAADSQAAANSAWNSPLVRAGVEKILADHKATMMMRRYFEPMNFWVSVPVKRPADFSGLTIRIFSPDLAALIKSLGGSPVSVPLQDVYAGLQRGVFKGIVTGSGGVRSMKFSEVTGFGYIANFMLTATVVLVNKDAFNKLPPDLQKVLVEEMKTTERELLDHMPRSDKEKIAELSKGGLKLVTASAKDYDEMRQKARENVWPGWMKRVGPNADEILKGMLSGGRN